MKIKDEKKIDKIFLYCIGFDKIIVDHMIQIIFFFIRFISFVRGLFSLSSLLPISFIYFPLSFVLPLHLLWSFFSSFFLSPSPSPSSSFSFSISPLTVLLLFVFYFLLLFCFFFFLSFFSSYSYFCSLLHILFIFLLLFLDLFFLFLLGLFFSCPPISFSSSSLFYFCTYSSFTYSFSYSYSPTIVDVVSQFREFTGPLSPELARTLRPKSLRAAFGTNVNLNGVHSTDLPDDGEMECTYIFHTLASLSLWWYNLYMIQFFLFCTWERLPFQKCLFFIFYFLFFKFCTQFVDRHFKIMGTFTFKCQIRMTLIFQFFCDSGCCRLFFTQEKYSGRLPNIEPRIFKFLVG